MTLILDFCNSLAFFAVFMSSPMSFELIQIQDEGREPTPELH